MSGVVFLILRILLAASLYTFLAWALWTTWSCVQRQGQLLAMRQVPPISLSIRLADETELSLRFTQPEVTIGRDPACECPVGDETVSARHTRLSFHHGQWWVEDLQSTNGTLLNNEKLLTPAVIIGGDVVSCGNVTCKVQPGGSLVVPDNH